MRLSLRKQLYYNYNCDIYIYIYISVRTIYYLICKKVIPRSPLKLFMAIKQTKIIVMSVVVVKEAITTGINRRIIVCKDMLVCLFFFFFPFTKWKFALNLNLFLRIIAVLFLSGNSLPLFWLFRSRTIKLPTALDTPLSF